MSADLMDTSPDIALVAPALFKYNNALPDFMKKDIPLEMEQWKKQMIEGFEKVSSSEKKDWYLLLSSIRLFRR